MTITPKTEGCMCRICIRSHIFHQHLDNIIDEDTKQYVESIYNDLNNVEEDLECHTIYMANVRRTFPTVFNLCYTIESIHIPSMPINSTDALLTVRPNQLRK